MIRIGQDSRLAWATRRVAEASGGMAAILIIVWLFRGTLSIERYSFDMLFASFSLVFLALIFDTRTNSGPGRAVSSFLWNLTMASVLVIVLIWLLEWIATAKDFPSSLASAVSDLVVAALITGLGAFASHKFSPRRGQTAVSSPLFAVHAGQVTSMGEVRVTAKRDAVGAVVKRSGRVVGCVILGDLQGTFNTPMGEVNATLVGPVMSAWIPFEGQRLDKSEAQKITGKTADQLLEEARLGSPIPEVFGKRSSVDLPFVHIEDSEFEEDIQVGAIRVRKDPEGGHVKVGPVTINSDDSPKDSRKWYAKGAGDAYFRAEGGRVSAKWNGSLLTFEGSSMKLKCGSDSFSYNPAEITTNSPLHTLGVTKDKVTLDTRKFTMKVMGDMVVLRAEDKTRTTESKDLADDLRALLTETAKKQVRDVMQSIPIDLSEMLTATEEVLARHG